MMATIAAPRIHHQRAGVTLWHGDALEVLRTMADTSVDCCVTSPPYLGLRNYGIPGQVGAESSLDEYVQVLRDIFAEVRRVLADDGTLWINIGDSFSGSWGNQGRKKERGTQRAVNGPIMTPVHDDRYPDIASKTGVIKQGAPPKKNLMGLPWRVAFALQNDTWVLRNAIIWERPNAIPESIQDRLSTRYEHVFFFAKSPRYHFNLDAIRVPHVGRTTHYTANPLGKNPGDVWSISSERSRQAHFATFPPELPERCILAGCKPGGLVLDPFSGSGTTGLAAIRNGREYVGIDLNPEYLDLSLRTRLKHTSTEWDDL
jgi:site-specific DNA-methyltransferase (cytosine-N4-specific)